MAEGPLCFFATNKVRHLAAILYPGLSGPTTAAGRPSRGNLSPHGLPDDPELIVRLQQRIDAMKERYAKLEKTAKRTDERLRELEEDIRVFEENLAQWKQAQ